MFVIIQNDTLNLHDISRISRNGSEIRVFFISRNDSVTYIFENENDASEVEYKIFKGFEEHGLVV